MKLSKAVGLQSRLTTTCSRRYVPRGETAAECARLFGNQSTCQPTTRSLLACSERVVWNKCTIIDRSNESEEVRLAANDIWSVTAYSLVVSKHAAHSSSLSRFNCMRLNTIRHIFQPIFSQLPHSPTPARLARSAYLPLHLFYADRLSPQPLGPISVSVSLWAAGCCAPPAVRARSFRSGSS